MRQDHSRFFDEPASDRDPAVSRQIGQALLDLWEKVRDRLPPDEQKWLGETYAPDAVKATDDHAWAQVRREIGDDQVNLTIELRAGEVDVNAVGWTKDQAGLLAKWLRSPSGRSFWREHPDFELCFFVRQGPMFLGAKGPEVGRYSSEDLNKNGFVVLKSEHNKNLKSDELLAFHVRRAWPASSAVGAPDPLLDELVEAVSILIPVAMEANVPTY